MKKSLVKLSLILVFTGLLAACTTATPHSNTNICSVFKQYPKWYWESRQAYKRWHVPISVQMAIMRQESHFRADARPPRTKILGFIPWSRPSSAYGYAQAVDGTWAEYQKSTGNKGADRDNFADAVDFLSWYANRAHRQAGIPYRDAYAMYLAYHDGITGYMRGTYKKKRWLMGVARKVQNQANAYRSQLLACYKMIPRPSIWNLWLM